MGRLFGMRRAYAGALAALTLCYLFDYTYTIYGGNLFSTLAGEYAYSLSIALALLFLGLMARGLRTGRYRGWSAITLAACILAHIVPALFAIVGALLLIAMEMLPQRIRPRDQWHTHPSDHVVPQTLSRPQALWWGTSTMGIGVLLVAFWWVPFGVDQPYATSLNYVNVHTFVALLLPQADWWALILAGISTVAAFALRSRFGILMALLAGVFAAALIFDPQGSLFNTRFLPLWFLPVYLQVGWGVATAVTGAVDLGQWWWQKRQAARLAEFAESLESPGSPGPHVRRQSWPVAAVAGPLVALVVALGVVATPFVFTASAMESIGITPGPNQVTNWSSFNYSGYQAQQAYPEYRSLVLTMERLGTTNGCGQAMWQYDPSLNRFGTTQALMLLPYWSNGCIGSMEGLLFESAATTPYHFLNQAELSVTPSEAMNGLDYSALDVPAGNSTPAAPRCPLLHGLEHPGPRSGIGRSVAATGGPNRSLDIEPGGRLDDHHVEDLRSPEGADRDAVGERPCGGGRCRGGAVVVAASIGELVQRSIALGRLLGAERTVVLAPRADRGLLPAAAQTSQDQSHRGCGIGRHGQLPCLEDRHTGAGQGLVLPQLAGLRGHGAVPGHPQPHGRGAHGAQCGPSLRGEPGQPGRPGPDHRRHRCAVHPRRAGPLQKARQRGAARPGGRMTFRPPPKVVPS